MQVARPSSLRYTLLRVVQAGSEFLNALGQASKELEASRGSSKHSGSFGDVVASAVQRAKQVYAQKLTTSMYMVRRHRCSLLLRCLAAAQVRLGAAARSCRSPCSPGWDRDASGLEQGCENRQGRGGEADRADRAQVTHMGAAVAWRKEPAHSLSAALSSS